MATGIGTRSTLIAGVATGIVGAVASATASDVDSGHPALLRV